MLISFRSQPSSRDSCRLTFVIFPSSRPGLYNLNLKSSIRAKSSLFCSPRYGTSRPFMKFVKEKRKERKWEVEEKIGGREKRRNRFQARISCTNAQHFKCSALQDKSRDRKEKCHKEGEKGWVFKKKKRKAKRRIYSSKQTGSVSKRERKKKNGEEKEQQFSPLVYWIEHQHWTGNQDKLRSISKEANGNGRGELS